MHTSSLIIYVFIKFLQEFYRWIKNVYDCRRHQILNYIIYTQWYIRYIFLNFNQFYFFACRYNLTDGPPLQAHVAIGIRHPCAKEYRNDHKQIGTSTRIIIVHGVRRGLAWRILSSSNQFYSDEFLFRAQKRFRRISTDATLIRPPVLRVSTISPPPTFTAIPPRRRRRWKHIARSLTVFYTGCSKYEYRKPLYGRSGDWKS